MFLLGFAVVHDDDSAVEAFLVFTLGVFVVFGGEGEVGAAPDIGGLFFGLVAEGLDVGLFVDFVDGAPVDAVGFFL